MTQRSGDGSKEVYPMVPIGTVKSCFSTRNGTPRQPLVVPIARARVLLDPARVPLAALEGFSDYSHCWILYVFHLNTDLEKMWKDPARSKIKAKIETVDGQAILLSGVDLVVDGTPVLDIKPYLPYSDSVKSATVPSWVQEDMSLAARSINFSSDLASSLSSCWVNVENESQYESSEEFQNLIKEVLTWDIRSVSQHTRPHQVAANKDSDSVEEDNLKQEFSPETTDLPNQVVYHLILEGIDVSYRIDANSNVVVEKAIVHPEFSNKGRHKHLAL